MSHELRTPLNVIIGFSEMLTREAPMILDGPKREEYARLINESGHHLLSIVNDHGHSLTPPTTVGVAQGATPTVADRSLVQSRPFVQVTPLGSKTFGS